MKVVVYDCEIKNEIDGQIIKWSDHDKMGLSVGVVYDYDTDDYSVYFDRDIQDMAAHLNSADLVVGFNTKGFDEKLLRALGADLKESLPNFDMLEVSRNAAKVNMFAKGFKLDDHLEPMFGIQKTEHGAQAPIMYQKGEMGKLTSYCIADVKREKMLFDHMIKYKWVETKINGKQFVDVSPYFNLITNQLRGVQSAYNCEEYKVHTKRERLKWEIELLTNMKKDICAQGLSMEYSDSNRLDRLRKELDEMKDTHGVTIDEYDHVETKFAADDEIPF